jgi:hypothetical protein
MIFELNGLQNEEEESSQERAYSFVASNLRARNITNVSKAQPKETKQTDPIKNDSRTFDILFSTESDEVVLETVGPLCIVEGRSRKLGSNGTASGSDEKFEFSIDNAKRLEIRRDYDDGAAFRLFEGLSVVNTAEITASDFGDSVFGVPIESIKIEIANCHFVNSLGGDNASKATTRPVNPRRMCSFSVSQHCAALRCFALLCAALRCIELLCAALRCAALRFVALRCAALRCVALLCCIALHCAALRCIALRCVALRCFALRCAALRCAAWRCFALLCAALRCFAALRFVALLCSALLCSALRCVALLCAALPLCCLCAAFALRCAALRCSALRCSALLCAAPRCAALRCADLRCFVLRCAA